MNTPLTDHMHGCHLNNFRVSSFEIFVVRGIPILYYIHVLPEFVLMGECQMIVIYVVFFYVLMSGGERCFKRIDT